MYNYLQSQRVNLQLLQESACRDLVRILEKIDGSKALVLDEALFKPIDLVASSSLFSDRGVKLLKLQGNTGFPKDVANIIYLVRPQINLMDVIVSHVLRDKDKNLSFHIIYVPRRSYLCSKHLESKNVYGSFVHIEELAWNFYPVDSDVVSMELANSFRSLTVDDDPTILYQAAIGLTHFQCLYGRIPKIYGKGQNSQRIWEYAKRLGSEEKSMQDSEKGAIDQLILLDRSIDLLSVLATQLTYEGLVDQFYEIRQNTLTLPAEMFPSLADDPAPSAHLVAEKKTFSLHSGDKLYAELRDKHFNEVGKVLSRYSREISAQTTVNAQDISVQDLKHLVDKLPSLVAQKQSVMMHTAMTDLLHKRLDEWDFIDDLHAEQEFLMAEDIDKASRYIEDLLAKKSGLRNVLRLMCMQSAAGTGLKEKVLNYYKRELAHVYGVEVLLTVSNLEKAGLLQSQAETRSYAAMRKILNLTVDDVVEVEPTDISYVHSFYAPLTARIIEHTLKPLGWQSIKNHLNNLPGPTFEDFQAPANNYSNVHSRRQLSTPSEGSSLNMRRMVMVFFVGGCTYAEIAALRFLSQQEDNNVEFVIATTGIVNKNTFLESLM